MGSNWCTNKRPRDTYSIHDNETVTFRARSKKFSEPSSKEIPQIEADKFHWKPAKVQKPKKIKKTPETSVVSNAVSCAKSDLESTSRYNTRATSHFQDQFKSQNSRNKGENSKPHKTSRKVEFDQLHQNSDQESMNCKLAKSYIIMKHKSKRKKKTSKKRENWLKKILQKLQEEKPESDYKDIGFSNYDTYRDYIW